MSEEPEDGAPIGAVSIVFTDIEGSTGLWERHESEMAVALRLHDALVRQCIESYGGYEVKAEGDAFMVVFEVARHAVSFCMAVQESLMRVDWPEALSTEPAALEAPGFKGLRVRMGVHTGAPLARLNPMTGRTDYFGPVVNRAARVSAAAAGGQILITGPVWMRVQGELPGLVVEHFKGQHLKGIPEAIDLVQVLPPTLSMRTLPPPQVAAGDHTASLRVFGFLHRVGGPRFAFPVTRRAVTIGRSSACDLVLAEDGVSKVHCSLRVDPQGHFVVRDEGSTNGTFVNGQPVKGMPLQQDDRLRIGEVEFRLQIGTKKAEKARAADEQFTVATRVLRASDVHTGPSRGAMAAALIGGLLLVALILGGVLVALG